MVKFSALFTDDPIEEHRLPKPRPLVEPNLVPTYPITALPPLIRNVIEEVASYVKAPVAMISASALAAVSTAVQTRYSVRRDDALSGPATLYLLTVAESGERKTSVDNQFTGPIREWEAEQRKLFRERRAKYEADMEDWERQGEEIRRNIEGGFLTAQLGTEFDPRLAHQISKPEEPQKVRILRGDDTPEALAMALDHYPVASVISAEAGTIFGSHGMSAEAVTRNLAQANTMWDGGVIQRDRLSTGEMQVEGMRVTMGLQVQPKVLDDFVHKTGGLAKGIGYFARFLFSRPESTQGTRLYSAPPSPRPALAAFCNRMTTLLAAEAVFDEYGRLAPDYLGFDGDAQRVWVNFHDEVEEQLRGEEAYSGIRDVASKAADNAARLACCLHVFAGDPGQPINREAMVGACALMLWYLDEAVRFAREADAAPELADAVMLEEYLVREVMRRGQAGASLIVSVNEVRRKGPNRLRQSKSKRLDDALELLADHHRVLITRRHGNKGLDITLRAEVIREHNR
ncbi:YfjI family protein [Sphingomonas sp. M1-B02]|uniref:YfjI family protein n=1 Tax=Sphingomonas sp. M1-B02 TaxID=3114300 RepID=UPI00223EDB69|nr:YfjI family protein [Sphingomonas sp. S6-11]UZK65868.1 YfjI family protein [Sphingomonas sp. S6-11]